MTLDSRRRIALFLYTFHFKSHCKIHRIRRTAYPAVLPSHTLRKGIPLVFTSNQEGRPLEEMQNSRTRKGIPLVLTSNQEGRPLEEMQNYAFQRAMEFFEQNGEEQLTVKDLVEKMA